MARSELGAPPSHPVVWVLVLKDGREYECTGQTAHVAAASIGVLLSEVKEIHPKE